MRNRLLTGHDRLRRIADELEALASLPAPPGGETLANVRWELTREVLQHLALDERHVLEPLSTGSDLRAAAAAQRFRAELADLYQLFQKHMDKWDGARLQKQWAAYGPSVRQLLAALRDRMKREEAELYPLVAPGPGDAQPPSRNWAGDAWQLRDKILKR